MSFVIERTPGLVAAVAMLALAAWVLWLRPKDPMHQSLAALVVSMAWVHGFGAFIGGGDLEEVYAWPLVITPFLALLAAWHMTLKYAPSRDRLQRLDPWVSLGILVATAAMATWYVLRIDWFLDTSKVTPLTILEPARHPFYALIALIAAYEFRRTELDSCRNSLLLFAVAFGVEATFRPFFHAAELFLHNVGSGVDTLWLIDFAMRLVGIAVLGLLVAVLASVMVERSGDTDRQMTIALAIIGLAAANGIVVAVLGQLESEASDAGRWALFSSTAFWSLLMVGLSVYAILRYRLFNIELRARFVLRGGMTGAALTLLFITLSEVIENQMNFSGTAADIAGAVAVAIAVQPFYMAAERLTRRLMPGVVNDPDYGNRRRADLYRAAVEGAVKDGVVTDMEQDILTNLRKELQLTPARARKVEQEVLAA